MQKADDEAKDKKTDRQSTQILDWLRYSSTMKIEIAD